MSVKRNNCPCIWNSSSKTSWSICWIFNVHMRIFFLTAVLELSRIVPIFKSGDNTNPKNHRPISVLNFIATLFEKFSSWCAWAVKIFFAKNNKLCNMSSLGLGRGRTLPTQLLNILTMLIKQIIQVHKSLQFSWTLARPLTLSTNIFYWIN